jgi:hypothetical protein
MSKKNRKASQGVALGVEVVVAGAEVTEAPKAVEAPETPPGREAIGWTSDLNRMLRWVVEDARVEGAKTRDFFSTVMEVDKAMGHFGPAFEAVTQGEYDLASMNLFEAGMLERPPSVVEEEEVD